MFYSGVSVFKNTKSSRFLYSKSNIYVFNTLKIKSYLSHRYGFSNVTKQLKALKARVLAAQYAALFSGLGFKTPEQFNSWLK